MLAGLILLSCQQEEEKQIGYIPELPSHFPELVFPADNAYSPERWELGKQLFYSNLMSVDSTISCASCHDVGMAFTDQRSLPLGVEDRVGTRNATSLSNVAYHPYYTRDGAVPSLEMQVFVPIQEHAEFDFNIVLAGERLAEDAEIAALSMLAYNRIPDPYVITSALATFERTIVSSDSKYDMVVEGQEAFTQSEQLGLDLFLSDRLGCIGCHSGFDFTDYSIANNGLYEEYTDPGSYRVTLDEADRATFKVPSLRNLQFTYPYMHDGSMQTIEEVILHYEEGVKQHENLDDRIKTFSLNEKERKALADFLLTLSDFKFISNDNYIN